MINFTVYGVAAPAGSKTTGVSAAGKRFVRDSNPSSAHWKREVKAAAGPIMEGKELLEGALGMTLDFYRPRPKNHHNSKGFVKDNADPYPVQRPDASKLTRGVEDSMTGIVYRDDSQICLQTVTKQWGVPARVEVSVWVLEGGE